jgi:hypothetical protein
MRNTKGTFSVASQYEARGYMMLVVVAEAKGRVFILASFDNCKEKTLFSWDGFGKLNFLDPPLSSPRVSMIYYHRLDNSYGRCLVFRFLVVTVS